MDKYSLEKKIGKGSYGSVFVVKAKADNKRYVLKRIPLENMTPKEKKAAKQEALLLQTLQHPNIVSYKDSFLDNSNKDLCIVMTYCSGGDLSSFLKKAKKRLSEQQIMALFSQIALAIEFMHARKVLHRDLKSQNIFLTEDGTVKIGDFGIARVFDKTLDMAQTSIGTPLYMSPETVGNKPYNFKSDIWALGCILYEISSLKHPFNATNLRGLFVKIMRGVYQPIPFQYSSKLRSLIDKMLSVQPSKRPDAHEILKYSYVSKHVTAYANGGISPLKILGIEAGERDPFMMREVNNFKIQLNDLNISFGNTQAVAPASECLVQNLEEEILKKAPIRNPIPQKKMDEARHQYEQYKRIEREKQKVKMALEKLKEQKLMRQKMIEQNQYQRKRLIEKQRREKENKIEQDQRKKLQRAAANRRQLQHAKFAKKQQPQQISPISKNSPPHTPRNEYGQDIHKEVEKWQNKIQDIENKLKQNHQKQMQLQQAAVPHAISKLDQVRLERERKRKEDEDRRKLQLQQAAMDYHKQKIQAKQKQYQQYHQHSRVVSPNAAPSNYVENPNENEFKVNVSLHAIENGSNDNDDVYSDDDSEEDIDDMANNEDNNADDESADDECVEDVENEILTKEYKKILKETTKQLEALKGTISKQCGGGKDIKNLDDVKCALGLPQNISDDSDDEIEEGEEDPQPQEEGDTNVEHDPRAGRLIDRVELLKQKCMKYFNENTFNKLYEFYVNVYNSESAQLDDRYKQKQVLKILGTNRHLLDYCHLIDELAFVQNAFME